MRLAAQLASLDVPTPPLPERMSAAQAADLVGAISKLADEHVRRTGHGRLALSSLVLRSLKQAYYSPKNLGHAGLRSSSYCHFTSPIRRYPDLVCHRALLSAVGGGEPAHRAGELVELGAWCSEREREAMTIERDADDIARCFALEQALYDGRLGADVPRRGRRADLRRRVRRVRRTASIRRGRRNARGEGCCMRMLPVRRMRVESPDRGRGASRPGPADEWWEINEQGTILHGERTGATLRLGDPIDVRVARVDTIRAGAWISLPPSRIRRAARLGRRWQRAKASARSARATWRPTATPPIATSCSSGWSAGSCWRAPRSRRCAPPARS